MMEKVKVKICCIQSIEETQLAIKYGASAIGLVSEMPSGPGVISEDLIVEIVKQVPADISSFLLTSKTNADEIISQHKAPHHASEFQIRHCSLCHPALSEPMT